jgi:nicotinamidase-related amidase
MPDRRVLIVIDMQNDFIDGSLGTKEAEAIVAKVAEKITGFTGRVYYTMDTHDKDYLASFEGGRLPVEHCIKGTPGHRLNRDIEELCRKDKSVVVEKVTFGSVALPDILKQEYGSSLDGIELVGLCTDICVISNALILKAHFPEARITVDASCCAGVTPESHKNALAAMKMCHIEVINEA